MDRELIARNIINIIDVEHCHDYHIFMNDDLYEQLKNYLNKLCDDHYKVQQLMDKNQSLITMIVNNVSMSIEQKNEFFESLREFKRKYLMK